MLVDEVDDAELLRRTPASAAAFGVFYRRHERGVGAYFMRRTREPELAADLTAETFAAAFAGVRRFRGDAPAAAWLYGIAHHVWQRSLEGRQVEDRARRRLGLELHLTPEVLDRFEHLASAQSVRLILDDLPLEQAEAIHRRIVNDASYDDVAVDMRCSPGVARQRVSRGLRALRARKELP